MSSPIVTEPVGCVTGPDPAGRAPVFVTYRVTFPVSCKGSRSGSCDSPWDRVFRCARTAGGPAVRGVGHGLRTISPLVKSGSDQKGG